jgi:hypothetical protein
MERDARRILVIEDDLETAKRLLSITYWRPVMTSIWRSTVMKD